MFTQNTETAVKPAYIETSSENEQSQFVAQKILELRESGTDLKNIAILIRSGFHSNDLEVELKARNIPFVKHGGFKFVETSHIKDVTSYMKLCANPIDGISWQRILLLIEGIGPAGAIKIFNIIKENKSTPANITLDHIKTKSCYSDLIKLIRMILNPENKTIKPTKLLEKVIDFYDPFFQIKYDDHPKRKTRLRFVKNNHRPI